MTRPLTAKECIERVAVKFSDVTLSLPPPHRHHDVIRAHVQMGGARGSGKQGFMTSSGRFVLRTEAARIAHTAGQITKAKRRLYSEDLW
jgi:hypothetical protein